MFIYKVIHLPLIFLLALIRFVFVEVSEYLKEFFFFFKNGTVSEPFHIVIQTRPFCLSFDLSFARVCS